MALRSLGSFKENDLTVFPVPQDESPISNYLDVNVDQLAHLILNSPPSLDVDIYKTLRSLRRLDVTKALDLYAILVKSQARGIDSLLDALAHDLNKRVYASANRVLNSKPPNSEKKIQASPLDHPDILGLAKRIETVRLAIKDQGVTESMVRYLINRGELDQALSVLRQMSNSERPVSLVNLFFKALVKNQHFPTEVVYELIEMDVNGYLNQEIVSEYLKLERLDELEQLLLVMKGDKEDCYSQLIDHTIKNGALEKAEALVSCVINWKSKLSFLESIFAGYVQRRVDLFVVAKRLGSFSLFRSGKDEFLNKALSKVDTVNEYKKLIDLYNEPQNRDAARESLMKHFLKKGDVQEAEQVALTFECPNEHKRDATYTMLARHFLDQGLVEEAVSYLPKFTSYVEREDVLVRSIDLLIDQGKLEKAKDLMLGPYQLTTPKNRDRLFYRCSREFAIQDDFEQSEDLALNICDQNFRKLAFQFLLAAFIYKKNGAKIEEISRKLVREQSENPNDAPIRNHTFKVKFMEALERGEVLFSALLQQTDPDKLNEMTAALIKKFPDGGFLNKQTEAPLVFFPDKQNDLILHYCNYYLDQGRIDDAISLSKRLNSIPLNFAEKMANVSLKFDKIEFLKAWVVQTHLRNGIVYKCVKGLLEKNLPEEALEFVKLSPVNTLELLGHYYILRKQLDQAESLLPLAIQNPTANDSIVHELLDVVIGSLENDSAVNHDINRLISALYNPKGDADHYIKQHRIGHRIETALSNKNYDQAYDLLLELDPDKQKLFRMKIKETIHGTL